jgi:hypothetical protein
MLLMTSATVLDGPKPLSTAASTSGAKVLRWFGGSEKVRFEGETKADRRCGCESHIVTTIACEARMPSVTRRVRAHSVSYLSFSRRNPSQLYPTDGSRPAKSTFPLKRRHERNLSQLFRPANAEKRFRIEYSAEETVRTDFESNVRRGRR